MSDDLGFDVCAKICERTGMPMTDYGHLLNPDDGRSDKLPLIEIGGRYRNFTNPYGRLEYACGSTDDFICMDFTWFKNDTGLWFIIDGTVNSETGCFIDSFYYSVVGPDEAASDACNLVASARDWCVDNRLRHDRKGWNQDPNYFYRSVFITVEEQLQKKVPRFSDRQLRFGGKRINAYCQS